MYGSANRELKDYAKIEAKKLKESDRIRKEEDRLRDQVKKKSNKSFTMHMTQNSRNSATDAEGRFFAERHGFGSNRLLKWARTGYF